MNMSEAFQGDDARDVVCLEPADVVTPGTIVDGSSWYYWAPPGTAEVEWGKTTPRTPLALAA
jgi:hypothetical protein